MENILKEILSWEKILKNSKKIRYNLKILSNHFDSIKKYKNSFEVLFFEELRSQFDRILEANSYKEKVFSAQILWSGVKNKKFTISVIVTNDWIKNLNKKRLALISKKTIENKKIKMKRCFGIVNEKMAKNQFLNIEMDYWNWKYFKPNIHLIQIMIFNQTSGLVGLVREFDVLNSFKHISLNLKPMILSSQFYTLKQEKINIKYSHKIHLLKHFNRSQIKAMISFLKTDVTLIQGPPGTGKTRTILGIISVINIIKNNLKKKPSELNFIPEKILICAPSNAAIDEIAMRATQGFVLNLKFDCRWPMKITRLGPNYHHVLDHISLENYAIIISSDIDEQIRIGTLNKIFKKVRSKILKKTPAIFTTLACTGHPVMKNSKKTETVIVDEAGQAIELSTLIPMKEVCKKIILIGDIQQLPATVFSKFSANFGYNRSLFKRFQLSNFQVNFLENQYRMHPQISSFPARKFYQNCLKDSQLVANLKNFQTLRCFGPLTFFDACEGQEQPHLANLSSWCNLDELRILSYILRSLICLYPLFNISSIGIIGGYNGQIDEIKGYRFLKNKEDEIQVNTIDGFQGREKDIICFTCVRAKIEKGIGFLADCRRVNVGFTRAKNGFWLIGNSSVLTGDKNWSEAIKDFTKRTRNLSIRKPFERSIRKIIYWSPGDDIDYSADGESNSNFFQKLLNYLKYL